MQTRKISYRLILLITSLALCMPVIGRTSKETRETYSFEMAVSPATPIIFKNKTGPLTVQTWDKSSVRVDVTVIIDGADDEVKKVLDAVSRIKFVQDSGAVIFNTKFYRMMTGQIPGHFKIVLLDGSTAKLTRLEVFFVLVMPKGNPLSLYQAYEKATLPDLFGRISIDLYESDMVAGKLPGCQQADMKYSHSVIDSVQNIKINLYETKFNLRHAGNVNLHSKYSEISLVEADAVTADSYEDKIDILRHGDLDLKAKYTTFKLADFNIGTFDLYECELKAGTGNIIAVGAKYCDMEFRTCKAIVFTTSYENKFTAEDVGDLKAGSNYSSYLINRFDGKMNFQNSYEDKIVVREVLKKFSGITINSKYSDIDLYFDPQALYKLDASLKYSELDYPKESYREVRYHKDYDNFQYTGVKQGADEGTAPVVELEMYEGSIKIR